MVEKANSKTTINIIAAGLILTATWFISGYFIPGFFYFNFIPLIILIVLYLHLPLSDKYLVPIVFSFIILYDLAGNLILKKELNSSPWAAGFWMLVFFINIFLYFFIFFFRSILNGQTLSTEKRREFIIRKLLWLTLVTIITVIVFCLIQKIQYYDNKH